jgi:uncharacterized protein (DUF2141 family)
MSLNNYKRGLAATLILAASAGGASLASNPAGAGPVLRVNIQGLEAARGGRLLVMLFGPGGFPQNHGAALVSVSRPLAGRPEAVVELRAPGRGDYAIKVLHDEDGDGRVGKNAFGIPREGLGFSSGARLRFGPPGFDEARFSSVDPADRLIIRMQYL